MVVSSSLARMRVAVLVCSACVVWAAAAARADPGPRLAGGQTGMALVDGPRIRVFTADGRTLFRLGAADETPDRVRPGTPARERLFDLLGVPESARDSQEAEDLFEEEATLADRRPPESGPPSARPMVRALAAWGPDGLWLVADRQVHRLAPGAAAAVRIGAAPTGVGLAAATAGRLWLARHGDLLALGPDGRPVVAAREPAPIRQLVAGTDGWLAWSTETALTVAEVGGAARSLQVPSPIRALAACGSDLLILAEDGLHRAAGPPGEASPIRIAGPLPGARIACRADGRGPWLLVGPALLASTDRGRTWQPRPDAPPAALADAALTGGDRLWLLTSAGALMALPEVPVNTSAPPTAADWLSAEVVSARRPPAWMSLLPRVSLLASHADRGPRRDQRLLAFAEFPLQAAPPGPAAPPAAAPAFPLPQLPPAEAACLPGVRARAVERALADPGRARSLVTRAGRAAWLPELRVRVERRLGRNESLDVKPAAPNDALGLDTVDDVRYEVRATWDLPRLVFNPEEVAAHHQALRTAEMRREIESQVIRLFFERRRLFAQPGAGPAEEGERLLRLEELAAELDALSGGAFSRCGPGPEAPPRP